ncbi:isochorismatase family protein [Erysipelotrichaceae bacterium RD49]|nr:isochorismatase family protein [Erysipelotrichaceae bacterium RD49]
MENTAFDPSQTAVLVIDMQKAFTEPESPICVAGAKEIIPAIAKFVDQAREAGMLIFWICRQHLADGSDMEEFRRKLLKREGCLGLLAPIGSNVSFNTGDENKKTGPDHCENEIQRILPDKISGTA